MKRSLFALVLILCLLLCSCAPAISGTPESTPPSEEPTATPTQPTEPQPTDPPATEPPSFPMGDTGAVTDGALRALPLDIGIRCNAYLWGDVALFYNANQCQIRSLEDGSLLASGPGIDANLVTLTDDYIIYFIYPKHQIVFRDKNLETVQIIDATVDQDAGDMVFTQDGRTAYYADTSHIVEHDIQTNEERWIPVEDSEIWGVTGLHFNESILSYWGKENGKEYTAFVDLKTGKYLGKDYTITRFQSWDGGYYLCRAENGKIFDQRMVSDGTGSSIMSQDRGTDFAETWALPQLNSFFTISYNREDSTVILDLYKRTASKRTASLTVNLGQPYQQCTAAFADPSGEYIWLCMKVGTPDNCQMVLYRWDFRANAVAE